MKINTHCPPSHSAIFSLGKKSSLSFQQRVASSLPRVSRSSGCSSPVMIGVGDDDAVKRAESGDMNATSCSDPRRSTRDDLTPRASSVSKSSALSRDVACSAAATRDGSELDAVERCWTRKRAPSRDVCAARLVGPLFDRSWPLGCCLASATWPASGCRGVGALSDSEELRGGTITARPAGSCSVGVGAEGEGEGVLFSARSLRGDKSVCKTGRGGVDGSRRSRSRTESSPLKTSKSPPNVVSEPFLARELSGVAGAAAVKGPVRERGSRGGIRASWLTLLLRRFGVMGIGDSLGRGGSGERCFSTKTMERSVSSLCLESGVMISGRGLRTGSARLAVTVVVPNTSAIGDEWTGLLCSGGMAGTGGAKAFMRVCEAGCIDASVF